MRSREEGENSTFKLGSSSSRKTINPAADDEAGRKEDAEEDGAHGEGEGAEEARRAVAISKQNKTISLVSTTLQQRHEVKILKRFSVSPGQTTHRYSFPTMQ
jgi:hypothetical protein